MRRIAFVLLLSLAGCPEAPEPAAFDFEERALLRVFPEVAADLDEAFEDVDVDCDGELCLVSIRRTDAEAVSGRLVPYDFCCDEICTQLSPSCNPPQQINCAGECFPTYLGCLIACTPE